MYREPSVRWNSLTLMHLRCPTDAYMLVYQIVLYKTTMLLLRIDLVHNLLPLLITGCWLVYQDLHAVIEAVAILQLTNLNIIAALSVAPMAMVIWKGINSDHETVTVCRYQSKILSIWWGVLYTAALLLC